MNLQIKVYPETEQDFITLMAESESTTKGKFLELLIENYRNPKVKTVFEDSDQAKRKIEEQAQLIEEFKEANQAILDKFHKLNARIFELESTFNPYLIVCKRDGYANDLLSLFKFMLQQLHKGKAFILEPADLEYVKKNGG